MPVYKDKERGTWYVVINKRDPLSGKNKATFKRGFATKREAVTYEKERLLDGSYSHTGATFREVLDQQIASADMTERSAKEKRSIMDLHFSDYVDMPIEKITKTNMLTWRGELKEKDLTVGTKNRFIGAVKSVFDFAENIYSVPNVSRTIKPFKVRSTDKRDMDVWTPQEFSQFISCVKQPVFQAYFSLLYWTGCRRSEGAALCKEDVDLVNGTISINKNLSHQDLKFAPLKTSGSKRIITVDEKTMAMLKPLVEKADPYVFGGDYPACTSYVGKVFYTAIKESGVKRIRIHDLRHSHATFLINNGANIVAVSRRLGHSSIEQTLKTYTHLLEKSNDELMEIIEKSKKSIANV